MLPQKTAKIQTEENMDRKNKIYLIVMIIDVHEQIGSQVAFMASEKNWSTSKHHNKNSVIWLADLLVAANMMPEYY